MAEQFSVQAVISAVDKGFSSAMQNAGSSLKSLGSAASQTQGTVSNAGNGMMASMKSMAGAFGIVQVASKALGIIKDSVGGAINRIDTLSNSQRVFANLGFSAKETSAAMKGLQNSIKGLPTGLDQAVRGVQLIAGTTKSLGQAQKVWSAINDSVIGFGGSSAQAENAVQQLSQAFSAGKVDAETWNSMIDSGMGTALNALAKNMGLTTAQLKQGLSDGTISVDQFQKALIDLDKNGGGGIKSLHKIALASTAGISTALTNAKLAIQRGIGDVINSLNKLSTDVTGSSIGQNISNIGKAAEKGFQALGKIITSLTPYIKNFGNFLKAAFNNEIVQSFIAGLAGAVGAFAAIKTGMAVFSGVKAAIDMAKLAWIAFQIALSTPLGIVTVIAGVVAALVYFFTQTKTGQMLWQSFISWLTSAWQALVVVATTVWSAIVTIVTTVVSTIQSAWTGFTGFMSSLWQGIVSVAQAAWQGLVTVVTTVWSAIQSVIQTVMSIIQGIITVIMAAINGDWSGAWNALKGVTQTIGNAIKGVVTSFMNAIKNVFSNIWNQAKTIFSNGIKACLNVVKNVGSSMVSAGRDFVMGFVNGVKGAIGNAISAVENMASSAVNAAKKFLKIHSPSRVMRELGGYTAEGFANGILGQLAIVEGAAERLANSAIITIPPSQIDDTGLRNSFSNLNNMIGGTYSGTVAMQGDTTVMNRVEALMQELVNKSGDVYMDGNKVGNIVAPTIDTQLGNNVSMKGRWS